MKRLAALMGLLLLAVVITVPILPQTVLTSNDVVLSGQQAITATAANLGTTAIKTVCVKGLHANTISVYIGGSNVSTSNGMEVNADQSWCGAVKNLGAVYIVATTTGASVSWIATK